MDKEEFRKMRQRVATAWWANPKNKVKIEKRNKKISKTHKKMAKDIDWDKFIHNSWKIRKKKYGKTGLKDPIAFGKKMSKVLTGKKQSQAFIKKRAKAIKENHWAKNSVKRKATGKKISRAIMGIKRSDETKERLSQYQLKHPIKYWLGKKRSGKTKEKISENRTGKLMGKANHSWRGGHSNEPYTLEFNNRLKKQVRSRDNFTCQECRQTEKELGYTLRCHHIDYDKKNFDPNDLISLCKSCHSQTNFSREDWTEYFRGVLNGNDRL